MAETFPGLHLLPLVLAPRVVFESSNNSQLLVRQQLAVNYSSLLQDIHNELTQL